mmetsp:Transcript_22132/g.33674  ORF Transcript_22132/g.33674 Transcript_22132/m.33674 type:complete len:218 (-) Transcript_22132:110-763(-)
MEIILPIPHKSRSNESWGNSIHANTIWRQVFCCTHSHGENSCLTRSICDHCWGSSHCCNTCSVHNGIFETIIIPVFTFFCHSFCYRLKNSKHSCHIDTHNCLKVSDTIFQGWFNLSLIASIVPQHIRCAKFRDAILNSCLDGFWFCNVAFEGYDIFLVVAALLEIFLNYRYSFIESICVKIQRCHFRPSEAKVDTTFPPKVTTCPSDNNMFIFKSCV